MKRIAGYGDGHVWGIFSAKKETDGLFTSGTVDSCESLVSG